MDNIKDIQKKDALARFFDPQTIRTNPFGENRSADRAYRRAERIVAALFLVTNHVPESEALRFSTRRTGLRMLEQIIALRDEMRTADSTHSILCRASIRHLISLVRVLSVSGFVSMQNTQTVIEGLDDLGLFLEASTTSALSESTTLTRDDLRGIQAGNIKDIKDTRSIKDRISVKDAKDVSDTRTKTEELTVREGEIIEILRGNGTLNIKDIASNLPEYSEKMIQRDLAHLVTAGKVKKSGFKRWSRYSIAE